MRKLGLCTQNTPTVHIILYIIIHYIIATVKFYEVQTDDRNLTFSNTMKFNL